MSPVRSWSWSGIDHYFPTGNNASHATTHGFGQAAWLTHRLSSDPVRGITQLAGIYLVLQISAYLFEFIQTYLMQWTGQKIMFDLRRDIFRHMQRMHVGFFDTHAVGRLVTRLTSDVDAINEMFTGGILAIVDDFFTLSIMAIVMLSINWWLALLAFAVLPAHPGRHPPLPQQRARELSPRPRRHRAHQQLHPGAHQRHDASCSSSIAKSAPTRTLRPSTACT